MVLEHDDKVGIANQKQSGACVYIYIYISSHKPCFICIVIAFRFHYLRFMGYVVNVYKSTACHIIALE